MRQRPNAVEVGRYLSRERNERGITLDEIVASGSTAACPLSRSTVSANLTPSRTGKRHINAQRAAAIASALGLTREKFRTDLDLDEDDTWLEFFGPPDDGPAPASERTTAFEALALDELWARWCVQVGVYPCVRPPGMHRWEYATHGCGNYAVSAEEAYELALGLRGDCSDANWRHITEHNKAVMAAGFDELGVDPADHDIGSDAWRAAFHLMADRGWIHRHTFRHPHIRFTQDRAGSRTP